MRSSPRQRRGGYAVEFALVLPVFMMVMGGILEYGNYYTQQMHMVGVVRDAARVGSSVRAKDDQGSPHAVATSIAERKLRFHNWSGTAEVSITVSGSAPDGAIGVKIQMPYKRLVGFVPTPEYIGHTGWMRLNDQTYAAGGNGT